MTAGTHEWDYDWNESNQVLGLDRRIGIIKNWWWYAKESINRASFILR